MATTFSVSDVAIAQKALPRMSARASFERALGHGFEAAGSSQESLANFACPNLFLGAALVAFARHYPLALSPDAVWLAIAQGLAIHINNDPTMLRHKFVDPRTEGKITIRLRRDGFVKGSPVNDWPGCFAEFTARIRDNVGAVADTVAASFTTTGPVEQAALQVTLMDAVQGYFEYRVETRCGIPRVTLLGTPSDWQLLRERAATLMTYDLGWWTEALLPVLDELVRASEGRPDIETWRSFVKENGGSGGTTISGWINAFFPYLKDRNTRLPTVRNSHMHRATWNVDWMASSTDDFTSGFATAPFLWEYMNQELPMKFVAGFAGVGQDPTTLEVSPAIGWAVADADVEAPAARRPCRRMGIYREQVDKSSVM